MKCRFSIIAMAMLVGIVVVGCTRDVYSVDLRYATCLGNEDAPIEIVVFSDFQCGFCRRTAAEIARIQRSRPGRVKVYFKHYPLPYHPQAINAAKATEAARLQGRFWEMHDRIFAFSDELTDETYAEIAAKIGLDVERFKTDMASAQVAMRIAADRAEGDALGVDGTPFILVNRTRFRGSYAYLGDRVNGIEGLK